MRSFAFDYSKESLESQSRAGRYHPARVLHWEFRRRKYRAVMPFGSSDDWDAFRDGDQIYVVVRNTGLGYVGLSTYSLEDKDGKPDEDIGSPRITINESNSLFYDSAFEEFGTDKWEDWSLRYLAKVLANYLDF